MSALVSTYAFATADLPGLLEAARSKPGAGADAFRDYFKAHARPLAVYDGSGFIFNTVLSLIEEHGIPLMDSDHNAIAEELQTLRGVLLYLFLTPEHRATSLDALLSLGMSTEELDDYYEDFHERREPGAGEAMADALEFLVGAIDAVPEDGVVLFEMG